MSTASRSSGAGRSGRPTHVGPGAPNLRRVALRLFASEFVGTALLILIGLSAVIVDFAAASPVAAWLGSDRLRRLVTGFLFGATGALIAISPVGRISGAHINPIVTLAFWAKGKMRLWHAGGYVVAQFAGAAGGAVPLLAWGQMGRSEHFGATVPGPAYGPWLALAGEVATTFTMVLSLLIFLGHRRMRAYTPLLFPFLYAIMVYVEAPISGTSTNPARTFGPGVVADVWQGWWVYWVGPVVGSLSAVAVHHWSPLHHMTIEVAKVYHFQHDPHGIFWSATSHKRP